MLTSFILVSALFFCQIVDEEACWSGGGGGGGRPKIKHYHHANSWNMYQRRKKKNSSEPREHWEMPESMKDDFGKWITQYIKNMTERDKDYAKGQPDDAGVSIGPDGKTRGISIPTSWQGYGIGNGGDDPPPWAIVPLGYGKPEFCFMEPEIGNCIQKMPRWGYNSYLAACHQFVYSGCGGNQNNFRTKRRCEESCLNEIQSNCQKFEHYIEY